MKSIRLILGLVAIAGLAACGRDGLNKLAGDTPAPTDPTEAAAVLDQEILEQLAADIAAEVVPSLQAALSGASCPDSGTVIYSSYPVTIPPITRSSSRTYTVNGVTYVNVVNYERTGTILLYLDKRVDGCLADRKIFGQFLVKGTNALTWTTDGSPRYRTTRYEHTYNYMGDELLISGFQEVDNNGTVKRTPVNRRRPL